MNRGIVKALSSPAIPNHVWFGYIPHWVLESFDFDAEFTQ